MHLFSGLLGAVGLNGAAVVGSALIVVAVTTSPTGASFTATTLNPGEQFATATLSLTNDNASAGQLVSITNMVPGDTATRTVNITNNGTVGFTYVGSIQSMTTPATALWTDTTNGIQVIVRQTSSSGTVLYPSSGSSPGPLSNFALPASATVAAGGTSALWMQFSLPTTAGNSFQGLTQSFQITYTATQLAGAAR